MVSKRNDSIDVTRCVSNYMIILLHASAVNQYCNQNTCEAAFWNFIYSDICPAALPVLFLISGFLMFKRFSINDYPKKIIRRINRLVIPYISWNVLFIIVYIIGSMIVPRLALRVEGFNLLSFSGILGKIFSLMSHPIDGPLWFIRTLFIYGMFSPLLYYFLRKSYLSILFILGVVSIGLICAYRGLSPMLALTYPSYSLLMYFCGGLISQYSNNPIMLFKNKWILFGCATGLCFITACENIFTSSLGAEIKSILSYALTGAIFLFIIAHINTSKVNHYKLFIKLRELSFFAYAGHFLFCSILLHLIAPYLTTILIGKQTLLTLIFCGGGIYVMWIIFFTCKSLCPNYLKLFDGNFSYNCKLLLRHLYNHK